MRRRRHALRRRYGRSGDPWAPGGSKNPYGQSRDPGPLRAGFRTDGGEDVRTMDLGTLNTLFHRAWNVSNTHDLRVIEEERVRRGRKRVWGFA